MPVSKRGGRWHYAFCIRGVRYRSAVPEARTKFEAERAETEAKQAVFEGRYGRPSGEHDFGKFVGNPDAENFQFEEDTFLAWAKENKRSWQHDVFRSRVLISFFRGKTFVQISPLLVEKFRSEMRRSPVTFKKKPERDRTLASVNRYLELLSRIFTLAIKHGLTDISPCSKVRKFDLNNTRHRYLLDEEEPLLFAQFEGSLAHLRRPVTVAIGTGMRRGDLLNLRKSQVDFQRNVVLVPNSKTGKEYTVPMNADVRQVMFELSRENQASHYLFVNPDTGQHYQDLKKGFAEACRKAGIRDLRWHDLRHTFGTRLAEAGCSEATIAELMGHTDPKTTRRYTHGTDQAKREAVEAVRLKRQTVCHNPATEDKQPPKLVAVSA
jgi:integrase